MVGYRIASRCWAQAPIGLPLSAEVAKKIQAGHASPYRKGSETLVDESVRKSWELNADQFSLRNPAQNRSKAAPGGSAGPGTEGRTTQLKAEIYKLVLYEEGTFLPSCPFGALDIPHDIP